MLSFAHRLVRIPIVVVLALGPVIATGCGDAESTGTGGSGGTDPGNGRIPSGCLRVLPPAAEPDLAGAPAFAEDFVLPTLDVEAELGVDNETRTVKVQLIDVQFDDRPPLASLERQVGGAQTLSLAFPTEASTEGLYYMEITLCRTDCDEERFVYTYDVDVSPTYERVRYDRGSEVERLETCIDVDRVIVD